MAAALEELSQSLLWPSVHAAACTQLCCSTAKARRRRTASSSKVGLGWLAAREAGEGQGWPPGHSSGAWTLNLS